MQVHEIMSRQPLACRGDDTLTVPARIMWDHDVGCVPVIDESGHAVGMITDRDISMAAYTTNRTLSEVAVSQTIGSRLISCLPADSIAHVEKLMAKHQIRRVPVVDEFGALVGLVSQNDLVREAVHERSSPRKQVSEDEVMLTLESVGQRPETHAVALAS
jgi:CBS-domain-containing membrane protein